MNQKQWNYDVVRQQSDQQTGGRACARAHSFQPANKPYRNQRRARDTTDDKRCPRAKRLTNQQLCHHGRNQQQSDTGHQFSRCDCCQESFRLHRSNV
jgi:hypothetical protein